MLTDDIELDPTCITRVSEDESVLVATGQEFTVVITQVGRGPVVIVNAGKDRDFFPNIATARCQNDGVQDQMLILRNSPNDVLIG
jgi:hypothetical protein